MKSFDLKTGEKIPCLGLGTWQLAGDICKKAVTEAFEIGYRHLDTAEIYGNQKEIGEVIKSSRLKRKTLFLVSKVWRSNLNKVALVDSCQKTLTALQTDYLDLLLIHWPNEKIPIKESLEAMALLKEKKLIKNYGVSNFMIHNLKETKGFEVVVNQVEFHPSLNQEKLKKYCDQEKIIITAFSPLAQGMDLKLPGVIKIARKYGKTESQVLLNWLRQKEIVAIPRSKDKAHLKDNFDSLSWDLAKDGVEILDSLNKNKRVINPDYAEWNN